MQKPFGLKILKSLIGSPFNHSMVDFFVDISNSTPLFINDPIKIINNSNINGIQYCAKATSNDYIAGIITSFESSRKYENQAYRKPNTERILQVCRDPFLVLEAVINAKVNPTDIGKFLNIDAGQGDTITGLSMVSLDYASLSDTSGQFRITKINSIFEGYSIVECIIQKHELLPYVPSVPVQAITTEVLTILSNGQTSFTLSSAPYSMIDVILNEGVFAISGVDFSVVGNTLTWLNSISLQTTDTFVARYYI